MSNMAFVVMIVLIACATSVVMEYLKNQRKKSATDDVASSDTTAQLDALEERIRVLERIVTENKFDLKREIDKL